MNTKKNRLSFEVFYNWFIRHDKNTCIYDIRNQLFTGIKYIDIIKEDVISTIINIVFKNNVCKDVTLLLR